jgi:hypothetical protein
VLALDANARSMPLPVLRKIRDLVKAGSVVVGPKPTGSPRRLDDPAEFKSLADELWGTSNGPHAVGAGKVYADGTLSEHEDYLTQKLAVLLDLRPGYLAEARKRARE